MNNKPWTETEDKLLLELRKNKVPFKKIIEFIPRSQDSLRSRVWNLHQADKETWYKQEVLAALDLETSSFEADTGIILSYCLKIFDGELFEGVITRKEILSGKNDYRLVKELIDLINSKVDILVTYYGTGFDIPFFRTRAMEHKLQFFKYGEKQHFDVYYAVKSKMKLHRNSLDSATTFLEIPGKNHVDLKIWNKARIGDKEALEYVINHNREDVLILEKLFNELKDYRKWQRKSL